MGLRICKEFYQALMLIWNWDLNSANLNTDPMREKSADVLFWELRASPVAWRPRISKLQFLIQKYGMFFCSASNVFFIFSHQTPGSGSVSIFSLKCWIQIWNQWIWIRKTACFYAEVPMPHVGPSITLPSPHSCLCHRLMKTVFLLLCLNVCMRLMLYPFCFPWLRAVPMPITGPLRLSLSRTASVSLLQILRGFLFRAPV